MKKIHLLALCAMLFVGQAVAQTTTVKKKTTTHKPVAKSKTAVKKSISVPPSNALKTTTAPTPVTTNPPALPAVTPSPTSVPPPKSTAPAKTSGDSNYSDKGLSTYTEEPPKTTTNKKTAKKKNTENVVVESGISPSSNTGDKGFWIGFRAGGIGGTASYSKTALEAIDPNAKLQYVFGYQGGLVLRLGLGKHLSIQPEILYGQKGVKVSTGDDYGSFKINVIEVPLMVSFSLGEGNIRPMVNLGGYGSYALSGESTIKYGGSVQTQKTEFAKDDSRLEYGAIGGLGLSIKAGSKGKFLVEARYNYGFGNADNSQPATGDKSYFRTITASVAYVIKL